MSRDKFDQWQQQWDQAQADGLFGKTEEKATEYDSEADFFGYNSNKPKNSGIKDVDAKYWDDVYRLSTGQADAPDVIMDHLLKEDTPVEDKDLVPTEKYDGKKNSEITDDLGKQPNPVKPETRGVDARSKVTPNWAGGEDLNKLNLMKNDLEKLEDKIAADPMVTDTKSKSVLKKIKDL